MKANHMISKYYKYEIYHTSEISIKLEANQQQIPHAGVHVLATQLLLNQQLILIAFIPNLGFKMSCHKRS